MTDINAAPLPLSEPAPQRSAASAAAPPVVTLEPGTVAALAVKAKGLSLAILATLASIAALHLGSGIFVPVMLSVVFSYALTPLVDRLEKWHLPRWLGAALVVTAVVGGLSWLSWSQADNVRGFIDSLPDAAEKLSRAMRPGPGPKTTGTLEKVEQAAEKLQSADATEKPPPAVQPKGPAKPEEAVRVQVERPKFSVKDYLWSSTMGLVSALGQLLVVIVLTFFLLSAGSTFRRKMMKLAGPSISEKKFTLEALDEVSGQIQRYLLVLVLLSVLTGVVTGAGFALLGMHNIVAWSVLAAVLNLIPYVGAIVLAGAAMLAAFLQFGTIEIALAAGFICIAVHTVIGQFLTPWLTGRASHMNSVTVFIGVLALGWVWGVWGLFLGVPILVITKVVCERIEDLKPIAEFLSD